MVHHFENSHPEYDMADKAMVRKCCLRRLAIAIDDALARQPPASITMEHGTIQFSGVDEAQAFGIDMASARATEADEPTPWHDALNEAAMEVRKFVGIPLGLPMSHRELTEGALTMRLAAERWNRVSDAFIEEAQEQ
jgi:hypothetical protein